MANVVLHSRDHCPYCLRAKELLERRQIPYQSVHHQDSTSMKALAEETGQQTMPQILIDGQLLGGYQQLAELDQRDQLASLRD